MRLQIIKTLKFNVNLYFYSLEKDETGKFFSSFALMILDLN